MFDICVFVLRVATTWQIKIFYCQMLQTGSPAGANKEVYQMFLFHPFKSISFKMNFVFMCLRHYLFVANVYEERLCPDRGYPK